MSFRESMHKFLEIVFWSTKSTHPTILFENISLLKLNPFIKLIHEIMSWEILGRMEMFTLHATLPTLLHMQPLILCWSAWGRSFVRQVPAPIVYCRFFCFNFVDWKVWQKSIITIISFWNWSWNHENLQNKLLPQCKN